jgi:gluconokinase
MAAMKAGAGAPFDSHRAGAPRLFVVMGVSGCGKSTVGRQLADALQLRYLEGDAFHPPANVAKMAAGHALTDADRHGWLLSLRQALAQAAAPGVVLACSALKRRYRDLLREGAPQLRVVHLHGSRDLLAARLTARPDHYMPASLLDSQLATLEAPGGDEAAWAFDIAQTPQQIVTAIVTKETTCLNSAK